MQNRKSVYLPIFAENYHCLMVTNGYLEKGKGKKSDLSMFCSSLKKPSKGEFKYL